jgi:hypothetical protein
VEAAYAGWILKDVLQSIEDRWGGWRRFGLLGFAEPELFREYPHGRWCVKYIEEYIFKIL